MTGSATASSVEACSSRPAAAALLLTDEFASVVSIHPTSVIPPEYLTDFLLSQAAENMNSLIFQLPLICYLRQTLGMGYRSSFVPVIVPNDSLT